MSESQGGEQFALTFPFQVLLIRPVGFPGELDFRYDGIAQIKAGGEACVSVFADTQKLQAFTSNTPLPSGTEAVAFESPQLLIRTLKAIGEAGHATHVAIDTADGQIPLRPTIDELIEALRAQAPSTKEILQSLFDQAKQADEFEYACTLLRLGLLLTQGWNPLIESDRLINDVMSLMLTPLQSDTKTRLGLLVYCHIIEMSSTYDVIGNLLQVCNGERYTMRGLFGKATYPLEKVKLIKEWALAVSLPGVGPIFDLFISNQIRNAFFHSSYTIHEDELVIASVDEKKRKTVSISKDVVPRINATLEFWSAFLNTYMGAIRAYKTPKQVRGRWGVGGAMVDIVLDVDPEHGLIGFHTGTL